MELVTIDQPQHAILREPAQIIDFPLSKEVRGFIDEIKGFIQSLESPHGKPAGLAAPQVGIGWRIFLMQIPPEAKDRRKDVYDTLPLTVWINPSYTPIAAEGQSKDWEGCYLSHGQKPKPILIG